MMCKHTVTIPLEVLLALAAMVTVEMESLAVNDYSTTALHGVS